MMKLEHIVGDIVCVILREPNLYKEINLNEKTLHLKIRGYDKMGLWVEHPGLIVIVTEDENGSPIPIEKQKQEKVDSSVLITWDNVVSIIHYPNREGYDYPSEFDKNFGFKIYPEEK